MAKINLLKLGLYLLKRCWLIIICAVIGFSYMYWRTSGSGEDTYTASGTMYVYNGNPNMVNYGYTSANDLSSAIQLIDTYLVVVRSNKVLDVVVERLSPSYPNITAKYIANSIAMGSVAQTGVLRISCTTNNPQKSMDICNAVMDVAPQEIIRVVSAGGIEIIDYATLPMWPNSRGVLKSALMGAVGGAFPAGALLVLLFLLNQKVDDVKELTDSYTLPVLASLKREKKKQDTEFFLLKNDSEMEMIEDYAKLRMNLLYTLVGKEKHTVIVTSSISGEGKSTIAANLAISVAMSGRKVLLIDADMRRGCQHERFGCGEKIPGLSDVLIGKCKWRSAIRKVNHHEKMNLLTTGTFPPNPTELLETPAMSKLLAEVETAYDLVVVDVPPINIVSDPLALSAQVAGGIFVVRQRYSDHREIKKALIQAEQTGLNLLGFVYSGERLKRKNYYKKGYYNNSYYLRNPQKNKDTEEEENVRKKLLLNAAETQNASNAAQVRSSKVNPSRGFIQEHHTVEKKRQEQLRKRKTEAYRKRRSEQYRRKRTPPN